MTARGDARKRQASPISMHSDAHNGLTEAEREALKAAACGNCGERTAVVNLAARIKAEAVQAERERVAEWLESDGAVEVVARAIHATHCNCGGYFYSDGATTLTALAAHAKGEAS